MHMLTILINAILMLKSKNNRKKKEDPAHTVVSTDCKIIPSLYLKILFISLFYNI